MRRRRRWLSGLLVLLGAVVLGTALVTRFTDRRLPFATDDHAEATPATVRLQDGVVTVTGGTISLRELDASLDAGGAPDAIIAVSSPPVFVLNASVEIRDGGVLRSAGDAYLLRSDAAAVTVTVADGGKLELHGGSMRSWDPATNGIDQQPADGRAHLVARGGTVDIDGTEFEALGVDQPGRRGVTIAEPSAPATRSVVENARFRSNTAGVELVGAHDVVLEDVDIEGSATVGLLVERSTGIRIDDVHITDSAEHGVAFTTRSADVKADGLRVERSGVNGVRVQDNTTKVLLRDALVVESNGAAVSVLDSSSITVSSSDLWSNEIGVEIAGTSDDVRVKGSRLTANRTAGVHILSAGSVALIEDNVIEHNGAGIRVADGNAEIGPGNRITANNTGVLSIDSGPGLVIRDNEIDENFGDGLLLVATNGVELRGNSIADNALAAFGVVQESDFLAEFRVDNQVGGGGRFGWVRVLEDYEVRLALGVAPDLPHPEIPTPEGYYFRKARQIARDAAALDPRLYPDAAAALAELEATATTRPGGR